MTNGRDDVDDVDVLDLTAIAQAYPVRRVRLDMSKVVGDGLLSVGDVVDMAAKLHTEPGQIALALDGGGQAATLELTLALAWVIGRKADPGLSYDEVRSTWRIEPGAPAPPDPTPPTRPRRARGTSSASRA